MTNADYKGPDRRQFKRIKKPFSLRMQVQGAGAFENWDIVLIKDISRVGLSFTLDKLIKMDTHLNLKINFGYESGTIECVGKVTRIKEFPKSKIFEIGVAFVDINKKDSDLIDEAAVEFYR